jgi:enoyl-CoA hydratase/carnithine racemase
MLFTGMLVSSRLAFEWGLVNRIATEGSALEEARQLAEAIVERGPLSNRLAKTLVEAAQDQPIDAALSKSTVAQQNIFDSLDLQEGAAAFLSKRSPVFLGR